jgi:hypothetical protein
MTEPSPNADYGVMCETCADSRGGLTENEAFAFAIHHMDQPFVLPVAHRPYVVKRLPEPISQIDSSETP